MLERFEREDSQPNWPMPDVAELHSIRLALKRTYSHKLIHSESHRGCFASVVPNCSACRSQLAGCESIDRSPSTDTHRSLLARSESSRLRQAILHFRTQDVLAALSLDPSAAVRSAVDGSFGYSENRCPCGSL